MGSDPSKFKGNPNFPVEQVSWSRVVEWCNAASEMDKLDKCYTINGDEVTCDFSKNGYRLPTEAEWEYACRAGTTGDYNVAGSGIDALGWTRQNSNNTNHDVNQKDPNDFLLFDMHGNVYEWCWDWFDDYPSTAQTDPKGPSVATGTRVIRGGSCFDEPKYAKSWIRADRAPSYVEMRIGFRVVRNK
jgi:formylglycine-generating enzyme required for sulfatase activity